MSDATDAAVHEARTVATKAALAAQSKFTSNTAFEAQINGHTFSVPQGVSNVPSVIADLGVAAGYGIKAAADAGKTTTQRRP